MPEDTKLSSPADVGSPKQGAAPPARRLCDGVGVAGRPRAVSPKRTRLRRGLCEGRQLRLVVKRMLQHGVCRRSGGTGSGGTPDICGGKE